MRRFLGRRSHLASDSKVDQSFSIFADDDGSVFDSTIDNEPVDIGKPRVEGYSSAVSTASSAGCSLVETTPGSSTEDLRAAVSAPFAKHSGWRATGKAKSSSNGNDVCAIDGGAGAGLDFGSEKALLPSSAAASAVCEDEFLARRLQAEYDQEAHAEEHDDSIVSDEEQIVAERAALVNGLAESLHGINYNVNVVFPELAPKSLEFAAMAPAGEVQMVLEKNIDGCQGPVPAVLVFNGQVLHPDVPLHFAGVRDGDTLALVTAMQDASWPEPNLGVISDDDDDPILKWAACQ